jgi:putative ABC transport system permease protein
MLSDLRYAFRKLGKSPGFTAIVVLILALGIGANVAIFSVVHALMLRPLPYDHAEELVTVYESNPVLHFDIFSVAGPKYLEWRKRNDVFQEMGALTVATQSLTGSSEPVPVVTNQLTPSCLRVMRVRTVLGRLFEEDEDRAGKSNVAILSHSLWQRQFGGRADIIGLTIHLDGKPYTVVGVLAASNMRNFEGSEMAIVPLDADKIKNETGLHYYQVIARLKPGITIAQSQDAMATLTTSINKEDSEYKDWGVLVRSFRSDQLGSWPDAQSVLLLQGAVLLLLLIACANTANLLLTRASARKKEIAIRLALGSTRWQLIRQLLIESVLLALLGGFAGVVLAGFGIEAANTWLKSHEIIVWTDVNIEPAVLIFSLVLSVGTGIAFGLVPAWQTTKTDLQTTLKGTALSATTGTTHHRMLNALVVGEIAMALLLLIGAGLFVRTLNQTLNAKAGFNPSNVLVVQTSLAATRHDTDAKRNQFVDASLERLRSLPGVKNVAAIDIVPMGGGSTWGIYFVGRPRSDPSSYSDAQTRRISPDYFHLMNVAVRRGRAFTDADRAGSSAVIVINETMAHQYYAGIDPIGQQIEVGDGIANPKTIVGVVADERVDGLTHKSPLMIYVPIAQGWFKGISTSYALNFVVRAENNPLALAKPIQHEIRALDPDIAFASIRPMTWFIGNSIASELLRSGLLTAFSITALLLAALGIYGLMSNAVTQRTNEFGIRLALGATPSEILRLVFRRGLILLTVGTTIGLTSAFIGTRYLKSLLHDVSPTDPLTIITVTLFLALVACLACWLPARRATQINPIEALRAE